MKARGYLELHLLRFRDGTPHPCAKVPVMHIPVTQLGNGSKVVVLGDFLLLYISRASWEEEPTSLCQVHLIAWKEGSVTLVSTANSFFFFF